MKSLAYKKHWASFLAHLEPRSWGLKIQSPLLLFRVYLLDNNVVQQSVPNVDICRQSLFHRLILSTAYCGGYTVDLFCFGFVVQLAVAYSTLYNKSKQV